MDHTIATIDPPAHPAGQENAERPTHRFQSVPREGGDTAPRKREAVSFADDYPLPSALTGRDFWAAR